MGAKRAAHVFEHHEAGSAAVLAEPFDKPPKGPESSGTVAPEACAIAGQREILARK